MKYIYYKDARGNFGDDLNMWLWPKMFGANVDDKKNTIFYGIGTILSKLTNLVESNPDLTKIVFGSGVRPSFDIFSLDNSWNIKFVRGPLSSLSLGGEVEYITDAAYAIRQLESFSEFLNAEKKHEISVIPHISSTTRFDWQSICEKLGFNFISPHSEIGIEATIREIASSKLIIAEAMHGAILADILRVPWKRFVLSTPSSEGTMVSEYKWMDWLFSIKIPSVKTIKFNLYRKTFLNKIIVKGTFGIVNAEFFLKRRVVKELVKSFSDLNSKDYYLSDEHVVSEIDRRIKRKIDELRNELN